MSSSSQAVDVVETFLRLVEDRRLDEAAPFLTPGAVITFPGGRQFSSLQEQVTSSSRRFRSVRKVFEKFDVFEDGPAMVIYVFGTLAGENLKGEVFSDVRFIDRFELRDGLIVDQKVWNVLAESSVLGLP